MEDILVGDRSFVMNGLLAIFFAVIGFVIRLVFGIFFRGRGNEDLFGLDFFGENEK